MTTTTMFHPLRVRSIAPDTAEAVVVSFDVPPALREVFGFTQGQYLTLRHQIDGQDLRRSYSICAGVDDGELRVGVRKVRGGQFSNWINEHLRPGDTLQVMAPQGRFFVPIEPGAARHHVGIAGGSGITPILSIMKTVLAREPASRFTLIYGNRQLQSTMFKEEIEDLKNRYMSRLSLQHVFSDEHTDLPLNMGVMDRAKIAEFLQGVVPAAHIDHVYICGPFQMNDEAEAALAREHYDAVVLDIELGRERHAGVALINAINKLGQGTPVLVVSAMPAAIYRSIMKALDAWDYLQKTTFEEADFIETFLDILRTTQRAAPVAAQAAAAPAGDALVLDPLWQRTPTWRGERINLPLTAQRILATLHQRSGEVVSYDELFEVVKSGRNRDNVRKHVSTIREALREVDPGFEGIENVPMRGFRWVGQAGAAVRT